MYKELFHANRPFPDRVAFFRISQYDADGGDWQIIDVDTFRGLNIRFKITHYNMAAMATRGDFGICNLSADMMYSLSNRFSNVQTGDGTLAGYNRFQFYAGYDTPDKTSPLRNVSLLFDGNIMRTSATMPPDVWFTFSSLHNPLQSFAPVEKTLVAVDKPLTFQQICQAIADYCQMPLLYNAKNEKSFTKYTMSGTRRQILEQLARTAPELYSVRVINGQLLVTDHNSEFGGDDDSSKTVWRISEKSGLLGTPQFNVTGAVITTLLNPAASPGDFVDLKSKVSPYWNGRYYVSKIEHYGELRGKNFCTRLTLIGNPERGFMPTVVNR